MVSYKDKQYLVFQFEDGKNVKYNLSNGETIGKNGRLVKDIKTQLKNQSLLDLINSFPDENYRNFLKFLDNEIINLSTAHHAYSYSRKRVNKICNIGTFLSRIDKYSYFEQFFACGVKNISKKLSYKINDIPKGLLKICKDFDLKLDNGLVESYKDNPNLFNALLYYEFNNITHNNIINIICDKRNYISQNFFTLITRHNYHPIYLLKYIDNLMLYEALDFGIISEFCDYVNMMSAISNKYEKYPKNFLTAHRIANRTYNRLKQQFQEEIFLKRIDKKLEYKCDKYIVIYPESTQDIKDESVQQNHCVASYIQNVIDGKCHIVFLREKDNANKSLITLEIKDYNVVQKKGKFNRDPNLEEEKVIEQYQKKLFKLQKGVFKNAS